MATVRKSRLRLLYILDQKGEPKAASIKEWAKWFEVLENRQVALDHVGIHTVSTVF